MILDALFSDAQLPVVWAAGQVTVLTVVFLLVVHGVLRLMRRVLRDRSATSNADEDPLPSAGSYLYGRVLPAFYVFLALVGNRIILPHVAAFHPLPESALLSLTIASILAFSWLLAKSGRAIRHWLDDRFDISAADNLRQRRMRTQIAFIERVFHLGLLVATFAAILAQFEQGRRLSTGLLASAGVASLVIGLAAQRTLANLIAGFQIAFTQPIRIDDAVVVEGEWGWIEEISLTYVVVRIWDRRRLVLPITYFVEKPFQNWTRKSGQILGSVFLEVAHHVPFAALDAELNRLLDAHPLWDRDARVLQIVESRARCIQLRALMTARNSPDCWDLRCDIRRGLLEFLVREHPDCLPATRIAMVDGHRTGEKAARDDSRSAWLSPAPSQPSASG